MREYVSTEVATVYRFGRRRYLTKWAAFAAQAKAWMLRDHKGEILTDEDFFDFEPCECLFCRDRYKGGNLHKRLTRYLMRCDRRTPPLTRAGRMRDVIERLMNAPYGHDIRRDNAGNSHVTLYDMKGKRLHTIVAPTFDEAVTRALDLADREGGTDA